MLKFFRTIRKKLIEPDTVRNSACPAGKISNKLCSAVFIYKQNLFGEFSRR